MFYTSKDENLIVWSDTGTYSELGSKAELIVARISECNGGEFANKLGKAFLTVVTHGTSDGQENESGTHANFFRRNQDIRKVLKGRSILYVCCWGGELGALYGSKFLPGTPIVACGSFIKVVVTRSKKTFTLESKPSEKNPMTGKPESGANRYKHWVVGYNGLVKEHKTVGAFFKPDYFIKHCEQLKRG